MSLAQRPEEWSEQEFDGYLFRGKDSLAKSTGWLTYHTLRSKGSRSGYPDRTLVRERVVFAELKAEKGKLSDDQRDWMTALAKAGAEVYLWRPSDLDEIGQLLGRRLTWWPYGVPGVVALPSVGRDDELWTPHSLWVSQGGRADECQAWVAP